MAQQKQKWAKLDQQGKVTELRDSEQSPGPDWKPAAQNTQVGQQYQASGQSTDQTQTGAAGAGRAGEQE